MMKPLLIAALAIVGLTFATESAQAGRRCCRNRCCGYSACNTCNTCNSCSTGCNACATGCSASPATDTNAAPPPPQQTTASGYQSWGPGGSSSPPISAAGLSLPSRKRSSWRKVANCGGRDSGRRGLRINATGRRSAKSMFTPIRWLTTNRCDAPVMPRSAQPR